jgi:aminoglycoside 3-N-acetyltransferase
MKKERLVTKEHIIKDLKKLGLTSGMTLIVHSSLKSIGRVAWG